MKIDYSIRQIEYIRKIDKLEQKNKIVNIKLKTKNKYFCKTRS